jgi:hypothetical protein
MPRLIRYRVTWSGASGGAGLSTFHVVQNDLTNPTSTDLSNVQTRVRLFFENTSEWLPNDVSVGFPQSQDVIDSATGDLVDVLTASSSASNVPGGLTTAWQNGVGTRVIWETGQVVGGRRVRGFTYLVPYGGLFDTDGTLTSAGATDILTNAAALISGLNTDGMSLAVYSDLRHDYDPVTAASVRDKPVILRSRRD